MRNKIALSSLLALLMVITFSCKTKKDATKPDEQSINVNIMNIGKNYLGPGTQLIPNMDSTLLLCKIEKLPMTTFTVLDKKGSEIYPKENLRGKLSWNDNTSLKVTKMPGVIEDKYSDPKDQIYIIYLKVKK